MITGLLGLVAAVAVGVDEYLLRYDLLARFKPDGFNSVQGKADDAERK